ncbi:MAG: hypothetical protein O3A13_12150 [Proteobacteria bacterium]|nr:hypothetical protein [Pseudomonadota bacterium]MDA0994365.1 hypothetical protein [Pseudomonadota bacterium]
MNSKTTCRFALAVLIAGTVSNVTAQSNETSVPPGILACAAEADVMRRLSCYDREVAASQTRPTTQVEPKSEVNAAAQPAPEPARSIAEVTPVVADIVATRPLPEPQATAADADPDPNDTDNTDNIGFDRSPDSVLATVVEIKERPYGELLIRLDNGQVWEQKHADNRFRLRIGEIVTVRKGAVTGYRLSGDSNLSIQVQRIR